MRALFILLALIAPNTWADDIADRINDAFEAVETVSPKSDLEEKLKGYVPPTSSSRSFAELQCITKLVPGMTATQAQSNIKSLAPYLDRYFTENDFPPYERMAFYSQAVLESWQFSQLSAVDKPLVSDNPNPTGAQADLVAIINSSTKEESAAGEEYGKKANYFGRGPLQLVGCANYIGTLHLLNMKSHGRGKPWVTTWKAPQDDGTEKQLFDSCSYDDIDRVSAKYEKDYGMPLDPYGVLKDPMKILILNGSIEFPGALPDRGMPRSIKGGQLMIDMNMAYWEGRCSKLRPIATKFPPEQPCPLRGEPSQSRRISRCYSECIKGEEACTDPIHLKTCVQRREFFEKFIDPDTGCIK